MRSSRAACLTIAASLALAACDPMPDASSASQAFADRRAEIDAIEATVRSALPPTPPVPDCGDARVAAASDDPAVAAEFARCHAEARAAREAAIDALGRLSRETLPGLLDANPRLLGVEVTEGASTRSAGSLGASNPGTDAAHGVSIDEHQVGWNLYQTAFAFTPRGETDEVRVGDGERRPGIEVVWTITEGERSARVRAVLLIDAQTDAAWRAARRRAAVE